MIAFNAVLGCFNSVRFSSSVFDPPKIMKLLTDFAVVFLASNQFLNLINAIPINVFSWEHLQYIILKIED